MSDTKIGWKFCNKGIKASTVKYESEINTNYINMLVLAEKSDSDK